MTVGQKQFSGSIHLETIVRYSFPTALYHAAEEAIIKDFVDSGHMYIGTFHTKQNDGELLLIPVDRPEQYLHVARRIFAKIQEISLKDGHVQLAIQKEITAQKKIELRIQREITEQKRIELRIQREITEQKRIEERIQERMQARTLLAEMAKTDEVARRFLFEELRASLTTPSEALCNREVSDGVSDEVSDGVSDGVSDVCLH